MKAMKTTITLLLIQALSFSALSFSKTEKVAKNVGSGERYPASSTMNDYYERVPTGKNAFSESREYPQELYGVDTDNPIQNEIRSIASEKEDESEK